MMCMAMAASWHMPPQLRHLFVTILIYNESCDPAALWEKYEFAFSDDFLHRARKSKPDIEVYESASCVFSQICTSSLP